MAYTIGVCGFSGTGSSAVVDLLKEYSSNQVIDRCEFILPYEPDGLVDLDFHLNEGLCKYSSSNTGVYRFIKAIRGGQFRYMRELTNGKLVKFAHDYLEDIVQCEWAGSDPANSCNQPLRDLTRRAIGKLHLGGINYTLEKIAGRELNLYPMGKMYFSSHPVNFHSRTREFTRRIINALEPIVPGKNIVLDQPFPGNNPLLCFPYFDNPKAIVVDRDPRDLYLLTKEFWFEEQAWRPLPTDTVQHFATYFRGLREPRSCNEEGNVLRIQFEDLVYRYDQTRLAIEEFLGLPFNEQPKRFFNPLASVNNTQLFKHYQGYSREIEMIEELLPEYLFPFEDFGVPDFNRKAMFE